MCPKILIVYIYLATIYSENTGPTVSLFYSPSLKPPVTQAQFCEPKQCKEAKMQKCLRRSLKSVLFINNYVVL